MQLGRVIHVTHLRPYEGQLEALMFRSTAICFSARVRRSRIGDGIDTANHETHARSILDEAVATTAMPADADMTFAEREMLGEWLACGAP